MVGEMRHACIILVWRPQGNRPLVGDWVLKECQHFNGP